ncbi:MAG: hypothetical protein GX803_01940 [Lentisphaerae bacterium]|jgi:hypothetical protein|nr:hypothetical protein [Lentisphaerota bacterium]
MTVTHKTRRGTLYYLHQGVTKTGKPKYYFSRKSNGTLADKIPPGYEIYETVNAQVFLRRKEPAIIQKSEIAAVKKHLPKDAPDWLFKIEVRKNMIVIHDTQESSWMPFEFGGRSIWDNYQRAHAHYMPAMRFILEDPEKRIFSPERLSFRGPEDKWISIGPPDTLEALAKKYLRHLGQDSIFELY